MLAFVDKNRDLFLTRLRFRPTTGGPSNLPPSAKLGSMVQSMQWNIECNMLATIRVRKSFWNFLELTFSLKDCTNPRILSRKRSEVNISSNVSLEAIILIRVCFEKQTLISASMIIANNNWRYRQIITSSVPKKKSHFF
jgi:hypothetical protein